MIDRTCNLDDLHDAPLDFKILYLEESKLLYPFLEIEVFHINYNYRTALRNLEENIKSEKEKLSG